MTIAILGCGQLARMLAQASARLGVRTTFVALAGESTACVDGLGPVVSWYPGDDTALLYKALGEPALVTVERESIDVGLLCALQAHCRVVPSPGCVLAGQNRKLERQLLQELAIPCANHRVVTNAVEARAAVQALGLPLVAKSTESGYDGKLQWRLRTAADVDDFCRLQVSGEWLLECWVNFEREVSVVAVRTALGEFRAYPITENLHRDGILVASIAPARGASEGLQYAAEASARAIMESLNYVGVMAVEFFLTDGILLVNELAPRVHNSGHWTMLGGLTSQFESHIRAILGMPLGEIALHQHAGMINILGTTANLGAARSLAPTVQIHLYNKAPAPLRKLGHMNLAAGSADELLRDLGNLHLQLCGKAYTGRDITEVLANEA